MRMLVGLLVGWAALGAGAEDPKATERVDRVLDELADSAERIAAAARDETAAERSAARGGAIMRSGSKTFTESVILGELLKFLIEDAGVSSGHLAQMGGTGVLWRALQNGEIDTYVDYTGTLSHELFAGEGINTYGEIQAALQERGLEMGPPIGFNNTYAFGMTKQRAAELGVETISDLRDHPELRLGFSNEFMERGDGWPAVQETYNLPHTNVRGMEQRRAYQALREGGIDVMNFYSTDAEIERYDLFVLEDDRAFFPEYRAVVLYRAGLADEHPEVVASILRLGNAITFDDAEMRAINARVIVEGQTEEAVAASLMEEALGVDVVFEPETRGDRLWQYTREHLFMVLVSLIAAIVVSIPLGIIAAKQQLLAQPILGVVGIIQTIPSLALLAVLMTPLSQLGQAVPALQEWGVRGVGEAPAIVALFLYSLLPIVRNTFAGLQGISNSVRESALALGMPLFARLWKIELPIASRTILAGIKTAAVINIGYATLGVLIGAGGYGQPIWTGLRRDDFGLVLEGALPAAGLALVAQGLFEIAERVFVPRGLRLKPTG